MLFNKMTEDNYKKLNLDMYVVAKRIKHLECMVKSEGKTLSIDDVIRDKSVVEELKGKCDNVHVHGVEANRYEDSGIILMSISIFGRPKDSGISDLKLDQPIGNVYIKMDLDYNTKHYKFCPIEPIM